MVGASAGGTQKDALEGAGGDRDRGSIAAAAADSGEFHHMA